jgi:hypothetical protein
LLPRTIFGSPITEIFRSAGSNLEDGKDGFCIGFIGHGNGVNLPRWLEVLAEEERMSMLKMQEQGQTGWLTCNTSKLKSYVSNCWASKLLRRKEATARRLEDAIQKNIEDKVEC